MGDLKVGNEYTEGHGNSELSSQRPSILNGSFISRKFLLGSAGMRILLIFQAEDNQLNLLTFLFGTVFPCF
jgi:hypothetical protein